ncbi:uncharacterized protein LOC116341964 [Contarinia nasturtii]|uniref:uncharacterized protein LOC116341964 n=1 Tax=Contarinia nasturtii TaxID=265458 RepID=UPI0012D4A03D|nr:uncharacterized protein LOC116341964 [Contarinia nasturtii]XP_031625266.1 uncharacterized protein LOC116341964 [Contarinia nasturtii]
MASRGSISDEMVSGGDKLPIKTELDEIEEFHIKSEVGRSHVVKGISSQTEVFNCITGLYEQILTRLSDMRNNQRKAQLLACSRQFNSIMGSILKKIDDYEANFGYSQDNTRQEPMAIGSLAWYEMFVGFLLEHQRILMEENKANVLDGNAVSRQFIRNLNLLDKFRAKGRSRFLNDI